MTNWPHYSRYMKYYEKYSRRLNGVLYDMCTDMPGHRVEGEVWAKVWIIGRSYASGIERHASNGLDPIVHELMGSSRWLDPSLQQLRSNDAVPRHAIVPKIAKLHGRLATALSQHTRGGNQVRSFVSKYMHFHAPVVPIYDSVVSSQIKARDWYPWSKKMGRQHPLPDGAEKLYWEFCVRIACIVDDWLTEDLTPTARNIDTYAYRWANDE